MLRRHADAAPLVDHVHTDRREGMADVAIDQLELEVGYAGLGQQLLASARAFSGSRPKPGSPASSLSVSAMEARQQRPADRLDDGDLGQRGRPPQRSIAIDSAWRTLGLSNGLPRC